MGGMNSWNITFVGDVTAGKDTVEGPGFPPDNVWQFCNVEPPSGDRQIFICALGLVQLLQKSGPTLCENIFLGEVTKNTMSGCQFSAALYRNEIKSRFVVIAHLRLILTLLVVQGMGQDTNLASSSELFSAAATSHGGAGDDQINWLTTGYECLLLTRRCGGAEVLLHLGRFGGAVGLLPADRAWRPVFPAAAAGEVAVQVATLRHRAATVESGGVVAARGDVLANKPCNNLPLYSESPRR